DETSDVGRSTSAAERPKNLAHGASRGSEEKRREAPEGRKREHEPASIVEETNNETTASFEMARLQAAPSDATKESGASAPEGTTACFISDLIPTTAHIDLTWGMSFDLYPLQTIESKKEYYARAIPDRWLTVFTHDPKIPWAYLQRGAAGKMIALEV